MSAWADWPQAFTLASTPAFARDFPNLKPRSCLGQVSPATPQYNCFAWAASVTSRWWQPDPFGQFFWPPGVPCVCDLASFRAAYGTLGYEVCGDGQHEKGFEKIAIYTLDGLPSHAARQLPGGIWTTKFGPFEDVLHTDPDCLNGPLYGRVALYMRRPRRP